MRHIGNRDADQMPARILFILIGPGQNRVIVEKINMMKRHTKATQTNQQGGIIEREGKIHISNVMPVDPKSGKPSRVSRKRLEDGTRVRVTQRSGELLDSV